MSFLKRLWGYITTLFKGGAEKMMKPEVEIEQAIKSAMFTAFRDGVRKTETRDIIEQIKKLKPSSELYSEELAEMEVWRDRTVPASDEDRIDVDNQERATVVAGMN